MATNVHHHVYYTDNLALLESVIPGRNSCRIVFRSQPSCPPLDLTKECKMLSFQNALQRDNDCRLIERTLILLGV